jgi:formylglycine-generating enzyme required for sulfatase activity
MAGNETEPDPLAGLGGQRESRRARGRAFDREKLFDSLQTTKTEQAKALANSVGIRFVLLPPGTFTMGGSESDYERRVNEQPAHEVVLTQPFYLSTHLVTQAEYQAVLKHNPSRFHIGDGGGPTHPVESVSWNDATEFCRLLSEMPDERRARRKYRLPTEAEWEYACRGGTATSFSHGESLAAAQANFDASRGDNPAAITRTTPGTTPVGTFPANMYGIFDMHGNVWEWCADWYDEAAYKETALRDPVGPSTGKFRVLRGGSWKNGADRCRAAYRNALAPHQRDSATGFRVVMYTEG